ncbi:MAG: hypothetical protein CMJ31_12640 [Phycisphaerae bacterium]|nr:hypothetical protein [Phycisphaerae bacterium]
MPPSAARPKPRRRTVDSSLGMPSSNRHHGSGRDRGVARAAGRPVFAQSNPLEPTQKRLDEAQRQADQRRGDVHTARIYRRWPYRVGLIQVSLGAGGRSPVCTSMTTRDISAQGVGLLHTAFVHNGTPIIVRLPIAGNADEWDDLEGVVVACRHVDGTVHQLGVSFDRELDPSRYEPSIGANERFAREQVETRSLRGAILCVEDCEIDRMLIDQMLADTKLRLTWVESVSAARAKLNARWSLIMSDNHLRDGKGIELLAELRSTGNHTPFILLTADNTPAAKAVLTTMAADAVLFKPVSQKQLRSSLASLLAVPQRDGTAVSSLTREDPAYGLIEGYIDTLREQGTRLQKLWEQRDAVACIGLATEIAGSAAPYGFGPIGDEAAKVRDRLGPEGWNAETTATVRRLMTLCQQVRTAESEADDPADSADAA